MKPVQGAVIDSDHEIFHLAGYWKIALDMKHSGKYQNNRDVYKAIEGKLSQYGFMRYSSYESWKVELYRQLKHHIK